MRKLFLTLAVIVGFSAMVIGTTIALANNFTVTANIPRASGVTYTITEISVADGWTDNHPTELNFGELDYDPLYGRFKPLRYFAIDLGVTAGGAGQPDNIQFAYDDLANPNADVANGRGGLGKKGTASVTKAVLDDDDVPVKSAVLLSQVASFGTLDKSSFVGGWPRVYIGLYDGSDEDLNDAGWEIFTTADEPDDYIGVLTISATVD